MLGLLLFIVKKKKGACFPDAAQWNSYFAVVFSMLFPVYSLFLTAPSAACQKGKHKPRIHLVTLSQQQDAT